ncbi:ABC transporter ATP-binding protein [Candidatus Micrarchaeota archaeon]|nr:ABC transporter ATP-binding protein [Candidatus Micrarchaeota archaeon]
MLAVCDVSKSFSFPQHIQVLKQISFDTKQDEFVSIIGPSGCGKTTLLNILGNLEEPTSGNVLYKKKNTRIGFVFQKAALLNWRTVEANVQLPSEIFGITGNPVSKWLQMAGLLEFKDYYPEQISGGMQQKVALVRALSSEPDVILMDEPFASIDEITREQLTLDLQEIWQKTHKTIFFVTHNVEEAVFLSDKIIVLSERPATVRGIIRIKLQRPRTISIKFTNDFLRYVQWIKNIMKN